MDEGRIQKAFRLLRIDRESDPEQIADALWLAAQLPAPPRKAKRKQPKTREEEDETRKEGHKKDEPPPPPQSKVNGPSAPAPDTKLFSPGEPATDETGERATAVRVPAGQALPQRLAIERALKPFLRRFPSRRVQVLDEEATADWSAEQQCIEPRFRPAPERWFDVALIAEETSPMEVWSTTLRELAALMARHGAFRQVRSLKYRVKDGQVQLFTRSGQPVAHHILSDPENRRVCLVVTMGESGAWREQPLIDFMRGLGQQNVVAILQMLPRHLWPHTELGDALDWVYSTELGAPNRKLMRRDSFGGPDARVPDASWVPMLTLEPTELRDWSRFVQSRRRIMNRAVWLAPRAGPAAVEPSETRKPTPDELVRQFRGIASRPAYQLLRLLAGAPLTLPVMRLMQRAMGGAAQQVHLAEVMLSGLIERITPEDEPMPPDEVVFDFVKDREAEYGVRELLLDLLSSEEERRAEDALKPARERILQYVYEQTGKAYANFRALLQDPGGTERLGESARAFLEVNKQIYERREGQSPASGVVSSAPAVPAVSVMQFSWDGRYLLVGRDDGSVDLWDAANREITRKMTDLTHRITALAFHRETSLAAFGAADGSLCLRNLDRSYFLALPRANAAISTLSIVGPATRIRKILGTANGEITIYNGLQTKFTTAGRVLAVRAAFAVVESRDRRQVGLVDEDFPTSKTRWHDCGSPILSATFSNGGRPMTFHKGGTVTVWPRDFQSAHYRVDLGGVLAASPDGDYIVSCSGSFVTLYQVLRASLSPPQASLRITSSGAIAVGPLGRDVAVALPDGSIEFARFPNAEARQPTVRRAKTSRNVMYVGGEDSELDGAFFEAALAAGHNVVSKVDDETDHLVANAPNGSPKIAEWAASEREVIPLPAQSDIPRVLELLDREPLPPMIGLDPPLLDAIERPVMERALAKLLGNPPGNYITLKTAPYSSPRTLIGRVVRQPEIRRMFPGGIYWGADKIPKRPGHKLFLLPVSGLRPFASDMQVKFATRASSKVHLTLGRLTDAESANHLRRTAGARLSQDRLAELKRSHQNVPRLVGVLGGILQRLGPEWKPPVGDAIAIRFDACVRAILDSLSPPSRMGLLGHAILHPNPPAHLSKAMGNAADVRSVAASCRWLYAWPGEPAVPLLTPVRRSMVKVSGDEAKEAHEKVVRHYQNAGGEDQVFFRDDYWVQHLIRHAAEAGGQARVEALLRDETMLGRYLEQGPLGLRTQIRGYVRNRFIANLSILLTESRRTAGPPPKARQMLDAIESRLADETAKPQ
jgi:hypothetical protein